MDRPPRPLALGYVVLGLVATAAAGAAVVGLRGALRWGLLLGLPLVVGALGQLAAPARRQLPHPAEVRVPALRHLPLIGVLVALDLAPLGVAAQLGWASFTYGDRPLSAAHVAIVLLGLPVIGFVSTVGWEWGLRARLAGAWIDAGRRRRALLSSVVAGTALSLPVLAPGFAFPERDFLLAGLAAAALRESISVRLYRRAGVLLSGAWRGLVVWIEALLVADWLAIWLPAASYSAATTGFYALRVAGPAAAAAVAWLWLGRLDRLDAERRRHP